MTKLKKSNKLDKSKVFKMSFAKYIKEDLDKLLGEKYKVIHKARSVSDNDIVIYYFNAESYGSPSEMMEAGYVLRELFAKAYDHSNIRELARNLHEKFPIMEKNDYIKGEDAREKGMIPPKGQKFEDGKVYGFPLKEPRPMNHEKYLFNIFERFGMPKVMEYVSNAQTEYTQKQITNAANSNSDNSSDGQTEDRKPNPMGVVSSRKVFGISAIRSWFGRKFKRRSDTSDNTSNLRVDNS